MEALPKDLLPEFLKGSHVICHKLGLWNGIWSHIFTETTFMHYGHESGGLVSITLKPDTVAKWILSLHICSQLRQNLASMKDGHNTEVITTHTEEKRQRILTDSGDR